MSTRALAASLASGLLFGTSLLPTPDAGAGAASPASPRPLRPRPRSPADAPAAPSAKVWIGRYDEYAEYLRTAPIDKVERRRRWASPSRSAAFFAPGGLAHSAAVKHLPPSVRSGFWESYKSEIAAYELDRLLGMDMVPPTVERRVGHDLASVQLWVEGCRLLKGRRPVGLPDARRVGEAGLPPARVRQPHRQHRPQPGQPARRRRVEPDPHRPLARVRGQTGSRSRRSSCASTARSSSA